MTKLRASDNFLLGSVSLMIEMESKKRAHIKSGGRPWKPPILWILDQLEDSRATESYDAGKHSNVVTNLGGTVNILVGDPELVQEILVTKNAAVDKTNQFEGVFSKLFGKSFLFSETNELWKQKRKATAHAFYKDRLVHMLEALKDKTFEA